MPRWITSLKTVAETPLTLFLFPGPMSGNACRITGNAPAREIAGSNPAQSNLVAKKHPVNTLFRPWPDLKVKKMMNKKRILICKACKAHLTDPLVAITGKIEMEAVCCFADGEAVTPRGRFLLLTEDTITKYEKMKRETIAADQAWVHLSDLSKAVGLASLTKRLTGCCDISGIDSPNRVCQCGEHVGAQFSDCYEHQAFQPDAKAAIWIDASISEKEQ